MRFITADDANKQMILTSQISSIDANATQTKQGNFFKVECEMAVSKDQLKKLRYGLEGKFVMVTGQKTYFSYYMEKFLILVEERSLVCNKRRAKALFVTNCNIKSPEIREVLNNRVNLGRYRKPCPERWLGQTSHGN